MASPVPMPTLEAGLEALTHPCGISEVIVLGVANQSIASHLVVIGAGLSMAQAQPMRVSTETFAWDLRTQKFSYCNPWGA